MPAFRTERFAFGLGLAVIAGLFLLLLPAWMSYSDGAPEAPAPRAKPDRSLVAQATPREEARVRPRRVKPQVPAPPPAPPPAPKPAAPPKLTLSAVRGDCWIEVRVSSASGKTLFVGTLTRGAKKTFSSRRLWIRFGAPETLDATLDAKRIRIPGGTSNAIVTRRGLRQAPA